MHPSPEAGMQAVIRRERPRTADVGSVTETNTYVGNINGDFILKYNKDISNNFNLDALAGVNYNQADTKTGFSAITNLLIPGFYNLSNSTKQPTTAYARTHTQAYWCLWPGNIRI